MQGPAFEEDSGHKTTETKLSPKEDLTPGAAGGGVSQHSYRIDKSVEQCVHVVDSLSTSHQLDNVDENLIYQSSLSQ